MIAPPFAGGGLEKFLTSLSYSGQGKVSVPSLL